MQARQLTRSQTDRRIGGVCGGIAEYFDIDPTLVRIAFVAAALLSGVGILLYIVLWIVLPKGDPNAPLAPGQTPSAVRLAEERYARGEISAEELQQIRSDLGRV
jgi:phage shock protein C